MTDIVNLMREYVRVADMCKGTNVKPWQCVKLDGYLNRFDDHPFFYTKIERYDIVLFGINKLGINPSVDGGE